jgi:small subunit ribosomal protein S5
LALTAFVLIETAISIMAESRLLPTRPEKLEWSFKQDLQKSGEENLDAEGVQLAGQEEKPLEDTVVKIFRCSKVVKGGRRFSFAALVVVGDRAGTLGIGYGKANEVPLAVEKGMKDAKKSLHNIALHGRTIPHQIIGKCRATKIVLVPASPGTGVIAGSSARAVLEYAGVQDVLTKVYGSTSAKNIVKATLDGLLKLRNKEMVESLRGITIGN